MEDPKQRALDYLERHKIDQLFQELGTRLMFERPDNPNSFLIEALERIGEAKQSKTAISFFTETDIETMFSMFDPTNKGYITTMQYQQALTDVGISKATVPIPQSGKLNAQQFKHCMPEYFVNTPPCSGPECPATRMRGLVIQSCQTASRVL